MRHPSRTLVALGLLLAGATCSLFGCLTGVSRDARSRLERALAESDVLGPHDYRTLDQLARSERHVGAFLALSWKARPSQWRAFARLAVSPSTTARARWHILREYGPLITDPSLLKTIYQLRSEEPFKLGALRTLYAVEPNWALAELTRLIRGGEAWFDRHDMWQLALGIADAGLLPATRERLASTREYSELVAALSLLVAIGPDESDRALLDDLRKRDGIASLATAGFASLGDEWALREVIRLLAERRVPGFLGQAYPTPITRLLRRQPEAAKRIALDRLLNHPSSLGVLWTLAAVGHPLPRQLLETRFCAIAKEAPRPRLASTTDPVGGTFVDLYELIELAIYNRVDLSDAIKIAPLGDDDRAQLLQRAGRLKANTEEGRVPLSEAELAGLILGMNVAPDPPDIEDRLGHQMYTSSLRLVHPDTAVVGRLR